MFICTSNWQRGKYKMKFLLTDKYTLLYIFLQIMLLVSIVRSSKDSKYTKSTIILCIMLIVFNYVYLSLNYVLKK